MNVKTLRDRCGRNDGGHSKTNIYLFLCSKDYFIYEQNIKKPRNLIAFE